MKISGNEIIKQLDEFYTTLEPQLLEVATKEWGPRLTRLDIDSFNVSFWFDEPSVTLTVVMWVHSPDETDIKHTYALALPNEQIFNVEFIKGVLYTYIMLEEESRDEIINE